MKSTFIFLFSTTILSSLLAQNQIKYTNPVKLDTTINSICDETSPVISRDGKMMFFTRSFCDKNIGGIYSGQDIYVSKMNNDGNWTSAQKCIGLVSNRFESAPVAISPDGKKLYVTNTVASDSKSATFGLSIIDIAADGSLSNPKEVKIKDFELKKNTFIGFHLSKSGDKMFISRFAKDSTDLEDIFISKLDETGNWSQPFNLGTDINTAGFESSPYLADDDSTLYFSTSGRSDGKGDGDIYVSKRLDNSWTKWSAPINIGSNINTAGFDGYFTPVSAEEYYLVSGNNNDTNGEIYKTKKIRNENTLLVNLIDKKSSKPLDVATVTCFDLKSKKLLNTSVAQNGIAKISIPLEAQKYYLVSHAPGFVSMEENFNVPNMMINKDTAVAMAMSPIEVGQKIQLNHIFFERSKANLLEESFVELGLLTEVLTENPNMEILVSGHTDGRGMPKANQKLSEARVKSVVEYLQTKGIDSKRLKYKGFGSSQPVATNATDEGRAKNRRVEFTILK